MDAEVRDELNRVEERLSKRLASVEHYPIQLTGLQVEMSGVERRLGALERAFEKDAEVRRQDRKWLVGTLLAFATLIVGATAVLLAAFGVTG